MREKEKFTKHKNKKCQFHLQNSANEKPVFILVTGSIDWTLFGISAANVKTGFVTLK